MEATEVFTAQELTTIASIMAYYWQHYGARSPSDSKVLETLDEKIIRMHKEALKLAISASSKKEDNNV